MVEFEEFHHLYSLFISCSICFIPRSINVRADSLAKEADSLAKEARARGTLFFLVPSWMVHTNHMEIFDCRPVVVLKIGLNTFVIN